MVGDGWNREKGGLVKPVANMDVFASVDVDNAAVQDDPRVDILAKVLDEFMTEDERVLLGMKREGATLGQIRDLLGMSAKSVINRSVDAVVSIASFFCRHLDVLENEEDPILRAYARGVNLRKIAEDNDLSKRTIKRRVAVCVLNHTHADVYREIGKIRKHVRRRKKMPKKNWRENFVGLITERVGHCWYVWGGQSLRGGPDGDGLVDCSGLVLEVLKEVGVLPKTFPDKTANDLWGHFNKRTTKPEPGDLAFYGTSRKKGHVMFYLGADVDALLSSGQCVVGMCGGGRSGMTYGQAKLLGVGLWVRTSPKYRRDFFGFRKVG